MYQVFCDNVKIADSRIDDLAIINPIVTLQANAAGSFTFSIPAEHPFYNSIQRLTSVIRVEQDGEIIFQGFCSTESVDFYKTRNITCDGDLAYLNDSILRPARYQGETPATLLTKYINQHNAQVEARKQFEVGRVTVEDPNNYIYCYTNMNPTIQEIKEDLLDDLGGYLRVRYENGHRYIDYLADSPRTCVQVIELGVNLLDYNSNIDEAKLATRCIPLGAMLETQTIEGLNTRLDIKSVNSNLDYVENQTAIDNFGIITKTVIFNDVNTASILKTKGQAWLNDNQFENIVLEVNAVDLSMLSSQISGFELLDSVRVKSSVHGMDRHFLLTKMVLDLNKPEQNIYTFGVNTVIGLAAQTVKNSQTTGDIANSINEDNWLVKAKKEAADLLSGVDGGYVVFNIDETTGQPYEILIMDTASKDTAQKVWRWNKNGLGYSSNGYDPDEFDVAITINGEIIADFIKTGLLRSVEIANGGTNVANAPFKVDVNGNMTANSATIKGSISGSTITGSSFDASGTVKRYRSNYSSSDQTRIRNIIAGSVVPTDADYEKYDLNSDGIIDVGDLALVTKLINGNYGSYYELSCPVNLNGSNVFGKIKTTDVSIHNKGIVTTCFNVKDAIMFDASATYSSGLPSLSIAVRDNNNALGSGSGATWSGITGNYNGFRILNGIVVGTY